MSRPVTLFTGQWADLKLEELCKKAKDFGYDGLELACWGDHFEVDKADAAYCKAKKDLLAKYGLKVYAISNHLVGQAVCDRIDQRHKSILPEYVWGDGYPDKVNQRAAQEMIKTGEAAARLGVQVVNGFTGSSIWHFIYSFPSVPQSMIDDGYADFAAKWTPILDRYQQLGIKFGLEVHPTEIAFDITSTTRALKALNNHPAFGFNFDASHFGYQGVDYIKFIYTFAERIWHVHIKDVWWSDTRTEAGVFGGYTEFGSKGRYWDFISVGHGKINFEEVVRALNRIGYKGPLSVEWEDNGMDREFGAPEAAAFVKRLNFPASAVAFDKAFEKK
jgi:sugar phosphate isomerase/epimerase